MAQLLSSIQPPPFRVPLLDDQGQLVETWARFFLAAQAAIVQILAAKPLALVGSIPPPLDDASGLVDDFANIQAPVTGRISGGAFTQGSVIFAGSGGILSQDNAKLFWDDTNFRLGIGTNSPQADLTVHIATDINFAVRSQTALAGAVQISAQNDIVTANIPLEIRATKSVFTTGTVGIGVATPGFPLDVLGQINSSTIISAVGSMTSPTLAGGSGTTQSLALKSTTGVGAAGADIIFLVGNNGATEAARILNSGNVGINTTNPLQKLDVAGIIRVSTNPTDPQLADAMYLWNQAGVGPTISGANFQIRTGTGGAQTTKLSVDANGVVQVTGTGLRIGDGSESMPSLAYTSSSSTGWYSRALGIVDLTLQSVTKVEFQRNGSNIIAVFASDFPIGWSSGSPAVAAADAIISRGGAQQLTLTDVLAATKGVGLDFATDAILKVRTRALSADASLTALNLTASGTLAVTGVSTLTGNVGVGSAGGTAQLLLNEPAGPTQTWASTPRSATLNSYYLAADSFNGYLDIGVNGDNQRSVIRFYNQKAPNTAPTETLRITPLGGLNLGGTADPGASNVSVAGKITTYNNIATAGEGVPAIYGNGRATAQTGAVASVATYTVGAADGSFLVSMNILITAFTTGTISGVVTYTDEGGTARSLTLNFSAITGVLATTAGAAGAFEGVPLHLRAKASTAITATTTVSLLTATYNVDAVITQLA